MVCLDYIIPLISYLYYVILSFRLVSQNVTITSVIIHVFDRPPSPFTGILVGDILKM